MTNPKPYVLTEGKLTEGKLTEGKLTLVTDDNGVATYAYPYEAQTTNADGATLYYFSTAINAADYTAASLKAAIAEADAYNPLGPVETVLVDEEDEEQDYDDLPLYRIGADGALAYAGVLADFWN